MAEPQFISEETESMREFLFDLPIFADIPKLQPKNNADITPAAAFLNICKEHTFQKDSIIAYDKDVTKGLYIFRSGTVRSIHTSFENDQREQKFFDSVPRKRHVSQDRLADEWLFGVDLHPQMLIATEPGSYILIQRDDFQKLIKKYPAVLGLMFNHFSPEAQDRINKSGLRNLLVRRQRGFWQKNASQIEQNTGLENGQDLKLTRRAKAVQLLPDEQIHFFTQRSRKILAVRLALGGFIMIAVFGLVYYSLITFSASSQLALGVASLAAFISIINTLFYLIDWINAFFMVTTNQLIRSEFLILKLRGSIEKADINKVQSIAIEKSNFIQKWFNIGTIQITTASQTSIFLIDYIDNPEAVEVIINAIQQKQSSVRTSKQRAEMRNVINKHFGVDTGIKEVKHFKPAPKRKTAWQRLRESFVKSEGKDSITYHKHPIALVRFIFWPTISMIVYLITLYGLSFFGRGVLQTPGVRPILIIITIILLFWFWWEFEDWRNDTFQITEKFIYDIDRLPLGLRESRKQAELNRIENVRTEKQGILSTLFNYGSVHVETAGAENNIVFENVKDPDSVQQAIFRNRAKYESKLAKQSAESNLDSLITLSELYSEAEAQKRANRFRPVPDLSNDDDEEYDDF